MLKRLAKTTGKEVELKTVDKGDKVKFELYVGGVRVGFLWQMSERIDVDSAIQSLVTAYQWESDVA